MAKTEKKPARKRKTKRWLIACIALFVLGLFGWMFFQANVIHVRRATVRLQDLPQEFDGTTVLYASDLDICGFFDANRMIRVFESMEGLKPDILLLGGDYVSATLMQRLNQNSASLESAQPFFDYLAQFPTTLGKFAICGDNDGGYESLQARISASGVQVLENSCAVIQKNGSAIGIVGVGADTSELSSLAGEFGHSQCIIALAHSPSKLVDIRVTEAGDGGAWADLMLAGHTHGGQVVLFGKPMLTLNAQEKQRLQGWSANSLVTTGIGCEGVNLRFGTSAEVWLITLECADGIRVEFDS